MSHTRLAAGAKAKSDFETRHWLVAPTLGKSKVAATNKEWSRAAELTRARWGSSRPSEAVRRSTDEPRCVR
jgi:hypothetical protein